jgi:hypothetical protein
MRALLWIKSLFSLGWGSIGRASVTIHRRDRSGSFPVAGHEVIVPMATFIPACRDPVVPVPLVQPAAIHPHMMMAIPAVVPRSPDKPWTRSWRLDHSWGGRSYLDIDDGWEGRQGGAQQHCCRQYRKDQGRGQEAAE